MKIFYTTFICIFFNVYITKAAKQKPFTIDIYLPIFSCLDEFVAGNLFYPVEEGYEYGTIWKDKGYTKDKNYPSLSTVESGKLIVETRYGLSRCGKDMFWEDVFLPIYVFKKDNFFIRFFFADTYAYPDSLVCNPLHYFKFVGNINVFCWLGNIKNIEDNINNNGYAPAPAVKNEGLDKIVVEKKEDLIKVVLSEPVDIFYSPGGCLEKINKKIDYFKEEDEEEEKKEEEEEKNKLEFDNNIFSFVFLGKDPFDDKYEGVFAKKNREGLTVQLEDKDPSLSKILYFDYFKKKIQSLFELDRIKNFLEKQKDFLGAKAASAGEEIKELLDNAFYLLKRYSEGNLEPQVKVLSKVKVIKEKNCCEKCCENICV